MAEPEVVRWYTRGFRVPKLIGKLHDGTRIPGGPYTVPGLIAGFAVGWVGNRTMPLWGPFGNIVDFLPLVAAVWAAAWAIGKIPFGGRNPASVARGIGTALCAPGTGRLAGRSLRARRPVRYTGRCLISPAVPGGSARAEPGPAAVATEDEGSTSSGPGLAVTGDDASSSGSCSSGEQPSRMPGSRPMVATPSGVQAVLIASARRQAGGRDA